SVLPNTTYEIEIRTVDESGNVNTSGVTQTATTTNPDTTPPASISDLTNTTSAYWIEWSWTNPGDEDFDHTEIYIDDNWEANVSKPDSSYNYTESVLPN
ncbi:hypothetical protein, partial [Methanohalophilus sp. WG1-DM]